MPSLFAGTKTVQLYRAWRAKRQQIAGEEEACRLAVANVTAAQHNAALYMAARQALNWNQQQVAQARAEAESAYSAFVTHLGAVMTAYWLPVAAVIGLLLGVATLVFTWWSWGHPLVPKP